MLSTRIKTTRWVFASIFILGWVFIFGLPTGASAQAFDEQDAKASLFVSPIRGSFLVDAIFDVSIFIDTGGSDVNSVEVNIKFPPDKLQIVKPSAGKSFISIWISPPAYSNDKGTLSFVGGAPNPGINTSSGLVSKVTFRAKKSGVARIEILPSSKVLANDGKGTDILDSVHGGTYTISPRPPAGPKVFSTTHQNENKWYNNNNFIVGWEKEAGVSGFSSVLDSFPKTVPDNTQNEEGSQAVFENLEDGLWYFHIKAKREGVWGAPSHFLVRVDATPPAIFQPKVEILTAAIIQRAVVSFFTTDALSGVDHYEVAVIDKSSDATLSSPVFVESESPYQLPRRISANIKVIVRAQDKAGNIREGSADATLEIPSFFFGVFRKDNIGLFVVIFGLVFLLAFFVRHFIKKHGIMNRLIRAKNVLTGKTGEIKARQDKMKTTLKEKIINRYKRYDE